MKTAQSRPICERRHGLFGISLKVHNSNNAVDDKFELNATTPAAHLPLPNFCLGSAGSGPIRPGFGLQVLRL
jgi:hypothetical protein